MATDVRLRLDEIQEKVFDIVAEQCLVRREGLTPRDRPVEDLGCESLDLVELVIEIEEAFDVSLPDIDQSNSIYKAVFTRRDFCLADLAELVYLQQGTHAPVSKRFIGPRLPRRPAPTVPFAQLGGRWVRHSGDLARLFEPVEEAGPAPIYRRISDGMRCVLIPGATVAVGSDAPEALDDERPTHLVELDAFLIDAEPVSAIAFCRFLNSVEETSPAVLADWFVLDPDDDRNVHVLIERFGPAWRPKPGAGRLPMILVSWYGANAYSLWAHGREWRSYRDEPGPHLPSEAQ